MILFEDIKFITEYNDAKNDYVFDIEENFANEWTLWAYQKQYLNSNKKIRYRKYVAEMTSLDELKIWFDIHIPNCKISSIKNYNECIRAMHKTYFARSTI